VLLLGVTKTDAWSPPKNMALVIESKYKMSSRSRSIRLSASDSPVDRGGAQEIPVDSDGTEPAGAPPAEVPFNEFMFGKPGEFSRDVKAAGISPRRFFFYTFLVIPGISILGNFFGCTSALLGALPNDLVASTGVDVYFPVRGKGGTFTKRYISTDGAYDFTLPANWLQDQAVVLAQAAKFQQANDEWGGMFAKKNKGSIPDVAFGPAAQSFGDGTENVSVIRAKLPAGFTLRALGSPAQAATSLLDTVIAAPGSGRTATLVAANEEMRGTRAADDGGRVYTIEYVLMRSDGRKVHNLAVISVRRGELLTLTVVSPEDRWAIGGSGSDVSKLRSIAESFRLL